MGTDTADYSASASGVTIDLLAGTGSGGDAAGDTLATVEIVIGSGSADSITGDASGNQLFGGNSADTLNGGDGNDTLTGGAGADVLNGGNGTDFAYYSTAVAAVSINLATSTFTGDATGDVLTNVEAIVATSFNDTLIGDGNANALYGVTGNDSISGGAGADTLDGGTGTDLLDYSASSAGVTVNLVTNVNSGGDAAGDFLTGFENVIGSGQNDAITGDGLANAIYGGAGDDALQGGVGADTLDGGSGTGDTVDYTGSFAGVSVNVGTNAVSGGDAAVDVITGFENATGSAFNDTLTGDGAANALTGNGGNDVLNGGAAADQLYGGDGDDTLTGGLGTDTMDGGAGIDLADYSTATAALLVNMTTLTFTGDAAGDVLSNIEGIIASGMDDTLVGDTSANFFYGGAGNDSMSGGAGADTLDGNTGTADILDYSASAAGVTVDIATNIVSGGDAAGDVITGFEYVSGSGFEDFITGNTSNNQLSGGASNDVLYGGAGVDSLYGGDGNDFLSGGAGNDVLDGGAGSDMFDMSASGVAVSVNLATGVISGSDGTDTLISMEGVKGSAFNDTLIGTSGDNIFIGGAGADSITGDTGIDTVDYSTSTGGVIINLFDNTASGGDAEGDTFSGIENVIGGSGNDSLVGDAADNYFIGGAGADTIDGGAGLDTLSYATSSAGVSVNFASGIGSGGDAAGDDIAGIQNLIGSNFNDTLVGKGAEDNVLWGGAGNDQLSGGTGIDTLYGGTGDDTYTVDSTLVIYGGISSTVYDLAVEDVGGGIDTVQTGFSWTLGDYFENLTLTGLADIDGTGNALDNIITGNESTLSTSSLRGFNLLLGMAGNDTLIGLGGNDTLDGGSGNDAMAGGTDSDTYVIDSIGDTVLELSGEGVDIVLSSLDYTISTYVENLTLTGTADLDGTGNVFTNRLTGNAGANQLFGLDGSDSLYGGAGNDTLDGGNGNDSLTGGEGDDLFVIDTAIDFISELSTGGTDTVQSTATYTLGLYVEHLTLAGTAAINGTGNASANILTGNTAANLLNGSAGNDTLFGGAGADTLDGGTGDDSMSGGDGNDSYIVSSTADVVVEAAAQGNDTVSSAVAWTLVTDVENLVLTGGANVNGTGSEQSNSITGNSGANVLTGNDGNDTLLGGGGNDTLIGGAGTDSLVGGTGNDTYIVDGGADVLVEDALGGTDTVSSSVNIALGAELEVLVLTGTADLTGTGNATANTITGNTGHNSLTGGAGNDTINGGAGDDTLDGGTNNDSMIGGDGNDVYYVDDIGDKVNELSLGGTDTVRSAIDLLMSSYVENLILTGTGNLAGTGNTGSNVITGNAGNNALTGGLGDDTMIGGGGADTLDGGSGNDSMSGGIGNDAYLIDNTLDTVDELAAQGRDRVSSTISYTLLANFEDLTLLGTIGNSGTGNTLDNEIIGNTGGNSLSGLDGNDSIDGAGGNDTINGGLGRDTMTGGTGNDLFFVDNASDVVNEAALGGTDTVQTALNHTLAAEVENLILTGTANLTGTGNILSNSITGTDGTNLLSGLDGNDSLYGGAGNDTLNGGTGNDSLTGGVGDDLYFIDSATDKITETSTGGVDTVSTALTHTLVSYLENLILTGSAAVNGTGNSSANVLTGNSGDNVLTGGSGGNDTLIGNAGNDTLDGGNGTDNMQGGAGNDYYIVDTAFEVLTEAAGQGTDTVQSNVSLTLGANFENLILTGTLTASGTGNVLNNRITGNGAINVLNGMDGNDTLVGGVGNDNLTGGNGADHFAFNTATSGVDVITDFNALNGGPAEGDMLEFTGLLNGTFAYLGSGAFTASGNTQAHVSGSQVQLDFDGNGVSDMSITLTGLTAASQLSALDFLFN